MSATDSPKAKAGTGWTDHERLVYLLSLIEHSSTKPDFKNAPLPPGRSVIACERMVGRLKTALRKEMETLGGMGSAGEGEGGAEKGVRKGVVRKRKGVDGVEEGGVRKKSCGVGAETLAEGKKVKRGVKREVKREEEEEEEEEV